MPDSGLKVIVSQNIKMHTLYYNIKIHARKDKCSLLDP